LGTNGAPITRASEMGALLPGQVLQTAAQFIHPTTQALSTTAINLEIHIFGYRITTSIALQRFNMEHPPEPDNSASMSLQQNNSSKAVILASGLVDVTHMSEHIAAMSVFLRSEFYRITDASSATRNAATSRLLQLPGELRNQIWEVRPGYTTTVCDIR